MTASLTKFSEAMSSKPSFWRRRSRAKASATSESTEANARRRDPWLPMVEGQ